MYMTLCNNKAIIIIMAYAGCSGAVVQWCSGALVQWRSGAVVQWCSGAVVQWRSGAVAQWCSGAVAQWRSTRALQWRSQRGHAPQSRKIRMMMNGGSITGCLIQSHNMTMPV